MNAGSNITNFFTEQYYQNGKENNKKYVQLADLSVIKQPFDEVHVQQLTACTGCYWM
jgi:hypothetical protein